jgi:hypothetical protein
MTTALFFIQDRVHVPTAYTWLGYTIGIFTITMAVAAFIRLRPAIRRRRIARHAQGASRPASLSLTGPGPDRKDDHDNVTLTLD